MQTTAKTKVTKQRKMKVPKPTFILHSLVNQGTLPQLTAEETESTLKCAEESETQAEVGLSRNPTFRLPAHIPESQNYADTQENKYCHLPSCFKVPQSRDFPDNVGLRNSVQLTPRLLPKLVNLSFSQPNSPKTPCMRSASQLRLATPALALSNRFGRGDQSTINTPCVMGALRELQVAQDVGLPDMLALIEDDLTGLSQVERQLLRNTDVELTDSNVVDYLLDVAHDQSSTLTTVHQHHQQQFHPQSHSATHTSDDYIQLPERQQCTITQENLDGLQEQNAELNVRRKRRRRGQKRMTSEEALAVRRQRSKRAARARREQQAPTAESPAPAVCLSPGVRRSKRSRRQSSRFEISW